MPNSKRNIFLEYPLEPGNKGNQMSDSMHIPNSLRSAGKNLRKAFRTNLGEMSKMEFIRAWASLAYLFPGLHPDAFDDADSGWPRVLKPFAAEAWRRADEGQ